MRDDFFRQIIRQGFVLEGFFERVFEERFDFRIGLQRGKVGHHGGDVVILAVAVEHDVQNPAQQFGFVFDAFRMDILAVGQFVFILEASGDVEEAFFVQPAAVARADAGKAVPFVRHHHFRRLLGLVVVAHHHVRTVNDDFSVQTVLPDAGLIDHHAHVFIDGADRSVLVAVLGRIHADGGARFGESVAVEGRLSDILEEQRDFRFDERAAGDEEFQVAAEDIADLRKDQRVVILKFFCFLGKVAVFDRFGHGRVKKLLFDRIGRDALHDRIINLVDDAGNDGKPRGLDFLEILDEFVDGFGKGDAAAAVDVIVEIGGQTENMRPGQNGHHVHGFIEAESVHTGAGAQRQAAVGEHHAFRVAGRSGGIDDVGQIRPVGLERGRGIPGAHALEGRKRIFALAENEEDFFQGRNRIFKIFDFFINGGVRDKKEFHLGVPDDVFDHFRQFLQVHGNQHAAQAVDRLLANKPFRAVVEDHADLLSFVQTQFLQGRPEMVDPIGHLPEGDPFILAGCGIFGAEQPVSRIFGNALFE